MDINNKYQNNDPVKNLIGKVIGVTTSDGLTLRGRLVNVSDHEIWLEKLGGNLTMVLRAEITRIWVTADRKVSQ